MKVYIVIREYDSYEDPFENSGVFATKKLAQNYIDGEISQHDSFKFHIETWNLIDK